MNQIHEKDWAEDSWGGHSGMDSNLYEPPDTSERDAGHTGKAETEANASQ